jgi:prepilin-type N-terminal cleavage/methylation domain-containing protein
MSDLNRQTGLTLIEMLISLVLSTIIFMSSYQVISNLVQYQVRASSQNDKRLDMLLIDNLLTQVIGQGINQYNLFYRNQKSPLFIGDDDSIQIVSRAYSDRYDLPGYRVYRLYIRDQELFISYRAYNRYYKSNPLFELATGLKVERIRFEYLESGDWINEWSDDRKIPEFIRINIEVPGAGSNQWVRGTSRL